MPGKYLPHILIAAVLMVTASCLNEFSEDALIDTTITFEANSGRMVTKAGLQYTDFEEGNKYLLYGLESADSDSYNWSDAIMYDTRGVETSEHLINYGEDLFFDRKTLDFYGATLCMTTDEAKAYPVNISSSDKAPVIRLEAEDNRLADLMYSKNLKGCTGQKGLLEMNFTHALSKVQIEVSKHEDSEGLSEARIKSLAIVNTSLSGDLDIINGKWKYEDTTKEREFFNGEFSVTTNPEKINNAEGEDAEMLIFPNEDPDHVLSLRIKMSTRIGGEKTIVYPLYTSDPEGNTKPFTFLQNKKYVLSIILLDDGVRVLVVSPQAYDWIDVDLDTYLGQPVIFGGLMWMDRNLGATNWDCENDWANTRGFYYQHGRNIPYIFDQEKYLNRNKAVKDEFRQRTDKEDQLDIGYEYFFTYNEKGERVYGAVQGGTMTLHYMYHVSEVTINGQKVGWVNNGSGWEWKGSQLTDYKLEAVPHFSSVNGKFLYDKFWTVQQKGYGNTTSDTPWTEDNGAPQWREPHVTSGNIAINPGDPGIYHFIFDARYYHDYLQSGAWCVTDCDNNYDWNHWRAYDLTYWNKYHSGWTEGTSYMSYKGWLTAQGCTHTRTEDTEKVNYYWADRNGNPIPENHPCPKGWRIPTKEDFAGIMPDHNIENSWAKTSNTMRVLNSTYGDVNKSKREAAIYGVDHLGRKVIYLIKNLGGNDCYRLRLLWKESNLKRNAYYGLTTDTNDAPMHYLEISRYYGDSSMSFDKYFSAEVGSEVMTNSGGVSSIEGVDINKTVRMMTATELNDLGFYTDFDWETTTEVMHIPICGFIYTAMGVDGMFGDGDMTILRCTDWSYNYDVITKLDQEYTEGAYPYNEALNWCCYIRTDRNTGLFSGSRKSLGDQIRCVRDVNAE